MKTIFLSLVAFFVVCISASATSVSNGKGVLSGDMIVPDGFHHYSFLYPSLKANVSSAPVNIDFLFMYTEGAKSYLGGQLYDVDKYAADQVNYLNMVFSNSALDVAARIVGVEEWIFDFDPDNMRANDVQGRFVPLTVTVPSTYKLDGLWPTGLMSTFGADVIIVVKSLTDNDAVCGIARVPDEEQLINSAHNQQIAVLNVGVGCDRDSLHAHELGHLLGSVHEDFNVSNDDYPDARAYECGDNKTIMHSDPTGRVPYYSNPDLILDGLACGDIDTSNNTRVFGITSSLVGSKTDEMVISGTVSLAVSVDRGNEGESLVLTVTREGDTQVATTAEIGIKHTSASVSDYSITSQNVIFDSGVETVTLEISLLEDNTNETEESLQLYLRNLVGLEKGVNSELDVFILANSVDSGGTEPVNETPSSGGGSIGYLFLFGLIFPSRKRYIKNTLK